jgi:methionyl-tRNA formyltransferase
MRVVFFGSGQFGVPALRWLAASRHTVVTVITQPDRPAGRGKRLQPTPLAAQALREGLPVRRTADVNDAQVVAELDALEADIGVVVDFGQKISPAVRSVFPGECINIHASLLPAYRGASPVAYAILSGETKTGVTVFRLTDRWDEGPILVTRETAIGPYETQEELSCRLAGVGCDALDAALQLHEQDPRPAGRPQDETQASYAPKLAKADGFLRFETPAEQIARRCRAMWPWPGGRCRFVSAAGSSVDVTLAAATASPAPAEGAPGTLTAILTVATGAGTLEIHSLRPAGKRLMGWKDFVNGRHVQPGDRFESLEH